MKAAKATYTPDVYDKYNMYRSNIQNHNRVTQLLNICGKENWQRRGNMQIERYG